MIKNLMSVVIIMIANLVTSQLFAAGTEPEKILSWRVSDFPPKYILSGKYQGQGNGQAFIDMMTRKLPEYSHTREFMPLNRFINKIKHGKNYCYPSFVKKKGREAFIYYSIPALISPGFQVAIRREDWQSKFNGSDEVSLASLLQNRNLKLGVFSNRSYTPALDVHINRIENADQIVRRTTLDTVEGLLKMLALDRIDYTLINSPTLQWHLTLMNIDDIIGLPVTESAAHLIRHVACTKNAWGKQVIEDINRVLRAERNSEEYRRVLDSWVGPKDLGSLRTFYQKVFAGEKGTDPQQR